ncbi:MAG: hypothetical protein KC656_15480, partial [Myxococcales bacterium]|nr:hypothetical protein [Myxococcales bacterium]
VALQLGDPAEAIRQLDTALGIAEVLSIPRLRAEALVRRARVRAALGEPDLALEELALAEAICEELELRNEWVEAGLLRVELALGGGDAPAAQAALQDTERRGEGGHVPDLEVWRARVREAASGQGARQPA